MSETEKNEKPVIAGKQNYINANAQRGKQNSFLEQVCKWYKQRLLAMTQENGVEFDPEDTDSVEVLGELLREVHNTREACRKAEREASSPTVEGKGGQARLSPEDIARGFISSVNLYEPSKDIETMEFDSQQEMLTYPKRGF